jgi:hypothetical protein
LEKVAIKKVDINAAIMSVIANGKRELRVFRVRVMGAPKLFTGRFLKLFHNHT